MSYSFTVNWRSPINPCAFVFFMAMRSTNDIILTASRNGNMIKSSFRTSRRSATGSTGIHGGCGCGGNNGGSWSDGVRWSGSFGSCEVASAPSAEAAAEVAAAAAVFDVVGSMMAAMLGGCRRSCGGVAMAGLCRRSPPSNVLFSKSAECRMSNDSFSVSLTDTAMAESAAS